MLVMALTGCSQSHRNLVEAVVNSVTSQWPPAYGDQGMCTQVQPTLWYSKHPRSQKWKHIRSSFL